MNRDCQSLTFPIPSALMEALPEVYFKTRQTPFISPSRQLHASTFNTKIHYLRVPSIIFNLQYHQLSNTLHCHHPKPQKTVINYHTFQTHLNTSFVYTQVSILNNPIAVWSNQAVMMFLLLNLTTMPLPLKVFPTYSVTTPKSQWTTKGHFTRDKFTSILN